MTNPPQLYPLPPLPEPFASFPDLTSIILPNASKGVPGVTFACQARLAGIQAAQNAPLLAPTPPFPYPYPPRCRSQVTALIQPGSPAWFLAATYWAYGWCEGVLDLVETTDLTAPGAKAAKESMWALRFPNTEFDQWAFYMGGIPPKPWDVGALRHASTRALYGAPKWGEWFAQYRKNNFQAPTCYWKHA